MSRDIKAHFMTGKTGSSTIRRSFAALLKKSSDLHAIPRDPEQPERPVNFGLAPESDQRLTAWMRS